MADINLYSGQPDARTNSTNVTMISAGDASVASLTSDYLNILYADNIGIQMVWTGAPVGVFDVQVSDSYNPGAGTTGTWTSYTVSSMPAPAGSGSSGSIDLNQVGHGWLRVVYTRTSGTGAINVYATAKSV